MSVTLVNRLPESHVEALRQIERGYWWYRGRIFWATQLVHQWQQETNPPKICYADLGCGTGGFGSSLSAAFPMEKTLLVDGDRSLVEIARREHGLPCLELNLEADLQLPWQPNLISCMDVIEHLADDQGFVKRIAKVLPRGGALVLSVPAFQFLWSDWDRKLGHHRRYRGSALRRVLEAGGFEIRTLRYMWSFLMPVAPFRKLSAQDDSAEFQPVPNWINETMVRLSQWEWQLSRVLPIPWGTSVITLAVKK